jgi:hypothetical protein
MTITSAFYLMHPGQSGVEWTKNDYLPNNSAFVISVKVGNQLWIAPNYVTILRPERLAAVT